MCVYLSANPRELNSLLKVPFSFYNKMTLKPMYNTISDAVSSILEISRKQGMITTSSLNGQLLKRWSTGNASCDVVFQPVRENCLQAMGLFSNTKERNFPKTSKERHERKNLPSQKEALDSVSVTKRSDLPKILKEQCKRKNLPSREEKSADKVVREHGVDLVGCRIRVWWPHDKVFYEGHITSFDQSEKKHTVNYDDGDQEILNLANENWELIEDDNTSNPIQESLPSSSDMFDMPLSCFIDSYCHTRKKKALNVVDDVAVLTPGTESKKIVHSKAKLYRAEERQKRALEIGDELLQHPPSSEEELMEKLDAMGLFSNTKEKNFPKTSKEQHERKNSPSQKEALSSVLITKKNYLPKIPKGLLKRKNSLSQEEALDSVLVSKQSDLPKTSKQQCKRKNLTSQEENSADKVVREHGVHLVGCRVRVWWPHDKMFYEGHITSFDQSEKKHTVNYDDGDQEILNLANENWELIEDDNTSNPIQESLPSSSDMFDMPLSCIIDSYRHTRKKKKVLNVVDDVAVLTPGTESKKIVHSKAKLYRGKATDDPAPSTVTMQQSSKASRLKVQNLE